MRYHLTDPWFEAEFVGYITTEGSLRRLGPSINGAQGLFLYSPCGYGERGTHALVIPFENPRNAQPVPSTFVPSPRWGMSGTGLHDLTLSPSINCAVGKACPELNLKAGECKPGRMCWHGFIQNGIVT
jgi:hypothetical protein